MSNTRWLRIALAVLVTAWVVAFIGASIAQSWNLATDLLLYPLTVFVALSFAAMVVGGMFVLWDWAVRRR